MGGISNSASDVAEGNYSSPGKRATARRERQAKGSGAAVRTGASCQGHQHLPELGSWILGSVTRGALPCSKNFQLIVVESPQSKNQCALQRHQQAAAAGREVNEQRRAEQAVIPCQSQGHSSASSLCAHCIQKLFLDPSIYSCPTQF